MVWDGEIRKLQKKIVGTKSVVPLKGCNSLWGYQTEFLWKLTRRFYEQQALNFLFRLLIQKQLFPTRLEPTTFSAE